MSFKVTTTGSWAPIINDLSNLKAKGPKLDLDYFGQLGVKALRSATPKDSGKTASSWGYQIVEKKDSTVIEWYNTNVSGDTNVAILLDVGHATRGGTFVEGKHFISPAIKPVFDKIERSVEGR
ncbi:MAG: HK97 gp10 family phage protein [Hyphomicrobiaceae bacterium]|nr:MAG: HK97 gp10 family phage protein [Hyphomicrobiaceae bacterium]